MTTKQALAIAALRQYHRNRALLLHGKTKIDRRTNPPRRSALNDARQVQVIGFNEAIERLPAEEQIIVHLVYAFGHGPEETAAILHICTNTAAHRAQQALEALAEELDKRDLL